MYGGHVQCPLKCSDPDEPGWIKEHFHSTDVASHSVKYSDILGNNEKKLKELLVKSFPVIKIKQLRPVVMCVLKNMSFIEDKYLRVLVRDKELYNDCDIVVKRHLWRDNQSLFGDEVSPFLR